MNRQETIKATKSIIGGGSCNQEKKLINQLTWNHKYSNVTIDLASDLIKMYNQPNYVCSLDNSDQLWWNDLLFSFNKTILKSFTNNNSELNEIILPRYLEALDNILYYAEELKEECKKKGKSTKFGLSDLVKKDKPSIDPEDLKNYVDGEIEKAYDQIKKDIKSLPEEILSSGTFAGDESKIVSTCSGLDKIRELQKSLRFSKDVINKMINKTIHKVTNRFRTINSKEHVDFFEADEFEEIFDLYNLVMPSNYFLKDLFVEEDKYGVIVDCVIDFSSSMSTLIDIGSGKTAFLPDVCKYLVYVMSKNNILRDIYLFSSNVYSKTMDEYLNSNFNGGSTNINAAIKYIIRNGNNPTLLITDGEDEINYYSENVYFLFVNEYSFDNLESRDSTAIQQYINNKQILGFFNGAFKEL